MVTYQETLIDAVIGQIRKDLEVNDTSAIFELLQQVEIRQLEYFLPEEEADELKERYGQV